jgi:small GTP-binding protein
MNYKKIDTTPKNYDLIAKFILIGNKQVGKSSFLQKYTTGEYSETYSPTIGSNIENCFLFNENTKKIIKLQIWDISGQDKYRTNINNFYKGTIGIIIMFDITNEDTFIDIRSWMEEINKYRQDDNVNIILVGNKSDSPNMSIQIKDSLAFSLATELKCDYIKISVKNDDNIDNVFSTLLDKIL